MRSFVNSLISWGPQGVLLLAAMDSAGVPIPAGVDALLLVVAAKRPESAWLAAIAAIVGSLAGNLVLFSLAKRGGQAYLDRHTLTGRGKTIRAWFQRYGLVTVFVPALLPIPLPMKIPVFCTAVAGVRTGVFMAIVAAARVPRYFGLAWLGKQLGHNAGDWLKLHAWSILAFALLLFVALFFLARFADRGKLAES